MQFSVNIRFSGYLMTKSSGFSGISGQARGLLETIFMMQYQKQLQTIKQ